MTDELAAKSIIIYADDDDDDLELVNEVFSKYSHNVDLITVSDGLEVISFLKNLYNDQPSPCLIILDINMPRMDGREALVKIRDMERFKNVPVIMFTTSSQPIDKRFAQKYNAGFLTKPLQFDQMDMIATTFIDHCTEEVKNNIRKRFS